MWQFLYVSRDRVDAFNAKLKSVHSFEIEKFS